MTKRISAILTIIVLLALGQTNLLAANTKTTVEQVTTTVTLSDDVDYIITGTTPFAGEGLVNITNTDHAVLILGNIKPSKASTWLKYIQINGVKAVNNTNCQIKLYNLGCIILPYAGGDKFKPLTVYSEKNFEGDSCNDFGLEHSDGYMNTLTDEKLNNRISSFKLKRGYMVTFSTKGDGRGYSRCFIAADKDVEMASLPGILDNSISSYRVFKWYDAGKKQLANDLNTTTMAALNVQSSYTWSQGQDMAPDYECVPNHIYEDYPSSRTIGRSTWSPHTKNNNEARNTADDHPQTLETILNNWENMMRTGMRLCSPASWDGSDYWNATGFLADFLDSIDARGWRCDIIDLHCYWAEGSFGNMHYWSDKYKRPIWISEWCWGASWNSNGAFASGVTESQVKEALQRICTNMNGWDYVERYYYWNGERDPSRLYKNGSLTPAGEYYASMNSGVGYNGKYDFVPKTPKQYDPTDLTVDFDNKTGVAVLKWNDKNGEMNASMSVQRRAGTGKMWVTIADIPLQEDAASYTYVDSAATNGCQYQVLLSDANNVERKTNTVMAASSTLQAGDAIEINEKTYYLGGNIIPNGSFEMGLYGWTNGKGWTNGINEREPLSAPYFQAVASGGNDGGAYLQAYGNGALTTESAVHTSFDIKTNTDYYFSVASCNMPSGYTCQLGVSEEGKASASPKVYINNSTANWITQFGNFNSGQYSQARVRLYTLGSKAQVDQMLLCQLFSTRDSAIADGIEKARMKAEAFKVYNTKFAYLNDDLNNILTSVTATDAEALETLSNSVENAILAYNYLSDEDLIPYAEKLVTLKLHGYDVLSLILNAAKKAQTINNVVTTYADLSDALLEYLPQTILSDKIKSPSFAKASDWTTKCGTYQDGDQRVATQDGVTCWNAWWSGVDATDETQTMAIKQEGVKSATHGLYALEVKASTEHYCLSDQHGYITDGTVTENTQNLKADYLDLNMPVENRWGTLYSAPIYLPDNTTFTIGFEGSKKGAQANAWLAYGVTSNQKNDKREGWWCATDFALRYTPLYKLTVVPNEYGLICLPYAARSSETMKFYQIVGINADYTQLCLEEIENSEAGIPCIYRSSEADAQFLEYGEAVSSIKEGAGNIRGSFTQGNVGNNYFYVIDGAFEKVTTTPRPTRPAYSGMMRPFTDSKSEAIPVLESWTGPTMPINGVTDEDKTANNERISTKIQTASITNLHVDGIYTLDGRSVKDESLKPGLYIKVIGGRMYKTIIK